MMTQWKRVISAILALVLLTTVFEPGLALNTWAVDTEDKTPGTVATGITGINLMDNAGYENAASSLQNWGYNSPVKVNTDTAFTHSGAISAKVAAGQTGEAYAYCNTTATYDLDAAFTAGMWVCLESAEDASHVTIYLERPDSEGGAVTAQPAAQAGWQQVTVQGTATSGTARQAIKFVVTPGNQGDIYFDDVFLYCDAAESINLIRNSGFDSNKDTWADASGFEIAGDVYRSGTGSAKLTGARNIFQATGWWPNRTSTDSGDALYYSAWVKGGENAGTVTLRVEVKGGNTKNYYSETISGTTEDWQQLTVTIPCQETAVQEMLFHITTTGESVFYVDDVTLNAIPIALEPPAPEEGHEPGTVITGEAGDNLVKNPGFEESTENLTAWSEEGAVVNTDTVYTHSGANSGKVSAGNSSVVYPYQVIGTDDYNTAFKAGIWVCLSNADDAAKVKLFVETGNGDALITQATVQQGWQKLVVQTDAADSRTNLVMKLEVQAGITGDIYFDDAFFIPQTASEEESSDAFESQILRNASLEELNGDGTITHWDIWPGNEAEGTRKFEIVSDAHTGKNAVRIDLVESNMHAIYQYCVDTTAFDFSADYMASVWVKLENVDTSALTFTVQRKDSTGTWHRVSTSMDTAKTDGWTQIEMECPGVENADLVQFDVKVDIGTGSGCVYLDDFDLVLADFSEDGGDSDDVADSDDGNDSESEILRNAGLEALNTDGSITHWDVWPGNEKEGVRKYAVVTDVVHSGKKAVKISPVTTNAHAIYQYCIDTSQFDFAESYIASVWVKLENVKVSALTLGVKRRDTAGTEYNLYTDIKQGTTDGWVQVTLEVPGLVGAELTQFDVIVDIGVGSGAVYLDDFSLVPADLEKTQAKKPQTVSTILRNPGLESLNPDGSILDWDVWPGDPAEGVRKYAVVTQTVHSGKYALKVTPVDTNAHAVYQYCTDESRFDFEESYIASVWVRLKNVDVSALTLGIKRRDASGTEYNLYTDIEQGTTNGWVKVKLEVPGLIGADISQFDVIVDIGAGTGTVYLDDFSLTPANLAKVEVSNVPDSILRNPGLESLNPDGSILHWDVWPSDPAEGARDYAVVTDVVHSGDKAVKINLVFSNGQAIYQYCVDTDSFDFTADYIATAWVKTENMAIYDGSGATLGVKRTDSEGNVHVVKAAIPLGTSDGWVQITLEVPAYEDLDVVQYDVVVDIGAGSGCIYLDDFDLVPTELEDMPNPNLATEDMDDTKPGDGKLQVTPDLNGTDDVIKQRKSLNPAVIVLIAVGILIVIMAMAAAIILNQKKENRERPD